MLIKTYKDLKFWQSSKEVTLEVIKLCRNMPNERVIWIISDQVIRSSSSVGACIAEGFGKYKGKEYRRFLLIALGSAQETEYWLELLKDSYPKFYIQIDKILDKNLETIKMLSATLKSLNNI